jgi:methylmalonyl-CoA/ethylmalonyl-CoA epimerase
MTCDSGTNAAAGSIAERIQQLMQPLRDDSPIVPRLSKTGPGFHHITFIVDDLPRTMGELDAIGFGTVGAKMESPRWREASEA